MKYTSQFFNSLSDAYKELNRQYGIEFENSIHNQKEIDVYDIEVAQTPSTIIVGCLKIDNNPLDFFENDEGAGTFKEFSNVSDRDNFLATLKKSSLFYLVDKYQHGNVHYSVSNTRDYPDSRWDVSYGCAVFIPCNDIQEQYKKAKKKMSVAEAKKKFINDSNAVLNSYSDYCNGQVYGYSIVTYDKKGKVLSEDECWGLIGYDYATKEKTSIMQYQFINSFVEEILKEVQIIKFNNTNKIPSLPEEELQKIHQNVDFNDVKSAQYAEVYGEKVLSVVHNSPDKAFVYHDNGLDKPLVVHFAEWQKNYGVSPDQFAETRFLSDIKEIIRKNLSQQNEKKLTLK
jgi:hypothetical protein